MFEGYYERRYGAYSNGRTIEERVADAKRAWNEGNRGRKARNIMVFNKDGQHLFTDTQANVPRRTGLSLVTIHKYICSGNLCNRRYFFDYEP